ncbi:hypothetical protein PsYK624_121670 [Phanerochaete sordida]|uniref:DUF6533 domain-containing protein n=1 Tax=Phanerochaete sordida TaxID=48140 RepID=A0A9P3GM50_9APHY|nr:hypothetical protein PsYK624_121670 [Phanerochaete sordida]
MLTLGREVDLIWRSPWSPVKVFFLVTRYTPFFELAFLLWPLVTTGITPRECHLDYQLIGWTNITGIFFAEIILMLRTWAVFARRRSVGIFLIVWTIATWVPNLVTVGMFLQSLRYGPLPAFEDVRGVGCHVIAGSSILWVSWLMIMVSEAPVLAMMAYVTVKNYRMSKSSDLFNTVFRDGTIFYLYLFAFSTANVVVVLTTPPGLVNLLTITERMVHSILTSRIILSLRALGAQGHLGWSTFSADARSTSGELEYARRGEDYDDASARGGASAAESVAGGEIQRREA